MNLAVSGAALSMVFGAVFSLLIWPYIGHYVFVNPPLFTGFGAAAYIAWCGFGGFIKGLAQK